MTSYGLRCGAAIVMAQTEDIVQELKLSLKKMPELHGQTSTTVLWLPLSM